MRLLETITADEMIAHFLKTEIHSTRFRPALLKLLASDGQEESIVDSPNLRDAAENAYRAALLGAFRGYGRNADVFTDLPDDVIWYRAKLDHADRERVRYIDDEEYWNDFSGGSRFVRDAVQRIQAGEAPDDQAAWFWAIADALEKGQIFPDLILLYNPTTEALVLLEGHVRMTGFLLRPENLPAELPVLLGVSANLSK